MEHHGKGKGHKRYQKDHNWILWLLHLNITDKKHAYHDHCHMDHQKEVFPTVLTKKI